MRGETTTTQLTPRQCLVKVKATVQLYQLYLTVFLLSGSACLKYTPVLYIKLL